MKGQSVGQPGLHGDLTERKDGTNTNECNKSAWQYKDLGKDGKWVVSGELSGCFVCVH